MNSFRERSTDNKLPADPDKLTDNHLKPLMKPNKDGKRRDLLVGKGLALRILPSGNKITFRYIYRFNGKQTAVTVGSYPGQSLKVLRGEYQELRGKVAKGTNPNAEKQAEREAKRAANEEKRKKRARKKTALRVEGLIDMFIDHIDDDKNHNKRGRPWSDRTRKEYKQHLYNHFAPKFGDTLVKELDAADISSWLGEIKINSPVQSNRILATLRVMFGWAVDSEPSYMDTNIAAGIKKKAGETSVERALDFDPDVGMLVARGEIKEFWNGMEDANPLHKLALQMILLTGQRPGEVYQAKWEHIFDDKKNNLWAIPKSVTKNRKNHKIPLTPTLKRHLKAIKKLSGDSPYLFPQSRFEDGELVISNKDKPVLSTTVSKAIKAHLPNMAAFTPNALRHSTATHLKLALKVKKPVVGQLLNHSWASVTDIYAQGENDPEDLRGPLTKWHRYLNKIVTGKEEAKVVNLR